MVVLAINDVKKKKSKTTKLKTETSLNGKIDTIIEGMSEIIFMTNKQWYCFGFLMLSCFRTFVFLFQNHIHMYRIRHINFKIKRFSFYIMICKYLLDCTEISTIIH